MALSIPEGKTVYTTRYCDFKGVDYSVPAECTDGARFSDCDNLMFDNSGLIEKRYGVRCLKDGLGEIHSMKSVKLYGKNELLIHGGNKLYKYDGNNVTPIMKEGYRRYSYLVTLPALEAYSEEYGYVTSRKVGFDISKASKATGNYKLKEMFMVKVSALPVYSSYFNQSNSTVYANQTPESMKEKLDQMTYSEIEAFYKEARHTGCDAVYARDLSPEHYNNLIKNGSFEDGKDGLDKYGTGDYEIYAGSMRVDRFNGTGCIYQHIPVKSTSYGNLYDEAVFYVTFLASEGWEGNIYFYEDTYWSKAQPNTQTPRTELLRPHLTGELKDYDTTNVCADTGDCKSSVNVFNNKAWITTENGIFAYDGIDVIEVEKLAYAPTTTALININHTYAVNNSGEASQDYTDNVPGSSVEAVNLITRKRVNTFALSHFCTDAQYDTRPYSEITLDTEASSVEKIEILTSAGKYEEADSIFYQHSAGSNKVKLYSWYYVGSGGAVCNMTSFYLVCGAPYILDGVTENLRVHFTAATPSGYEKKVDECHIASAFGAGKDDRLFLTGNEKYPNYIWYSEFENFAYLPDINYIVTGDGNAKNLGFTKINQNLLVHKEGNDQDTTVFMVSGSSDSGGKAIFTVTQGINGVGAISEKGFTNFDDMPLFLSDKGVYSVESTNVISEKTVVNRSAYVNPKLLKHNLKSAAMLSYNDMLLVAVEGYIYVLYPRKQSYFGKDTVHNAASFEALSWSGIPSDVLCVHNDGLYFGSEDGRLLKWNNDTESLEKYNDVLISGGEGAAVKCYFATKLDDDGSFMTLKTMIKRGCGIMLKPYAQSSAEIYVLTEKDHEKMIKYSGAAYLDFDEFHFGIVDFSTRDTGRIIPFNAKVKKYSSLCFKVQNNTLSQGFGVIGIEKRYTVGNYKKY